MFGRRAAFAGVLIVAATAAQARNDWMNCAVKAGRDLDVERIVLNCGLNPEQAALLRAIARGQDESAERERETLRILATIQGTLAAVKDTDGYERMKAAGVTEAALIELARRIAVDVDDPGQAFAELQQAVEVSIRVQKEARGNPSTDAFVAEVQRQVAALSASGDFDAARAAAEAALADWEAEQAAQRQRGIALLTAAFDQDMLRRDAPAAAAKLVRIADLAAGGTAGLSDLHATALSYLETGIERGAVTEIRTAAEVFRVALARGGSERQRALLLNDHCIALTKLGTIGDGGTGEALLAEAAAACGEALRMISETAEPELWALLQTNLGGALQEQGRRAGGADGDRLLEQAVAARRAALRVRSRTAHPWDWAVTQSDLGSALWLRGDRRGGAEGAALVAEAAEAFRAALDVLTENGAPADWARAQNNLAVALRSLADQAEGAAAADLYAGAVAAYRAALRVRSEAGDPMGWATTQNNLANALRQQGLRAGGAAGSGSIREALDAYGAALRIFTEEERPAFWANTREDMALAELALAELAAFEDARPHLEAALGHVEAALRIYDPERMAYQHEKAARLRNRIAARLAETD